LHYLSVCGKSPKEKRNTDLLNNCNDDSAISPGREKDISLSENKKK